MKSKFLAGMLCVSGVLLFGQQPEAPAPAPPKPQTPAPQSQTTATPTPAAPSSADADAGDFESQASFEVTYWLSAGSPRIIGGRQSQATLPGGGNLALPAAHKDAPGFVLKIPAGKFNRVEISYFQANGTGNSIAPENLSLYGTLVPNGDYLATNFRLRMLKLVWNYLTWPSPPEESKFRVKTFWGFEYASITSSVDAPFETSALFTPSFATQHVYYPVLGIGAEFVPSKFFYMQGQVSGFAFPHRAVLWDADASAVLRFYKHSEIFAGAKIAHMKSSPYAEAYANATLKGPYLGVRWVF